MRTTVSVVFIVLIFALGICAILASRSKRRIGKYVAWLILGMMIPILGNLIIIASSHRVFSNIGYYVYFIGMDAAVISILYFTYAYCELGKPKKIVRVLVASLLTVDNSTGLYNKRGLMENVPDFLSASPPGADRQILI